jgi:hypothetical protein
MNLFALLLGLFLSVAPGAWIAFTLAGAATPFSTRLGLAMALSPFVVGAQTVLLTAIGADFTVAAALAAVVNLPAAYLVWRGRPLAKASAVWLVPALCFVVVAAGLAALWLTVPGFRIYSWHNMMQAEAVYQVARLPQLPEDMGLAGLRLNYAWFGHIQIAAIARLSDASPFAVFPIANIAALAAFMLLMFDVVRRFIGDRPVMASLLTLAGLLSTNLAGVLLHYLHALGGAGDIRLTTPLHKFLHFDLMTDGLALFAGVIWLALRSIEQRTPALRALIVLTLTALALIYPLLLPAALLIAGAALAAPVVTEWWSGRGFRISRALLLDLASLILPVLIGAAYLRMLGEDSAGVAATIVDPWQMRQRLLDGALRAGGLWLPLLLPAAWRAWRTRDPARLALFATAAASAAMFVMFELPIQVQYKFLVAALLCVMPLAAEQAAIWLDRLGRNASWAAGAAAALILLAVAPNVAMQHVPWTLLKRAEPLSEAHFSVAAASPGLRWTDAVREQTPPATVVVRPPIAAPVEALTQRVAYGALGYGDVQRPGYTMREREMLESVKAYPRALLDHRAEVLATLYGDAPVDTAALDAEFAALHRPLALYLPRANAYLHALEAGGRGRAIYADDAAVVWLLGPAAQTETADAE